MKKREVNKAKREYKDYVCGYVQNHYKVGGIAAVHGDEILDEFIMSYMNGERGSGTLRALLQSDVNKALKAGLKMAISEGVTGVLVTESFFSEDTEILATIRQNIQAKKYVAGTGGGGEAVGILCVYSTEGNPFWWCAHNHKAQSVNGSLKRIKDETKSAQQAKLTGYGGNTKFVKQITGNSGIPLIEN